MTALPVGSNCIKRYRASRHSGTRPISDINVIVMHDTEGGTAASVARYFAQPPNAQGYPGGSAHLVVDDVECQRCLENEQVPWGAHGANDIGFHIEQCGFAKWSLPIWTSHRKTIDRAAYKAAYHCVRFGIPPVWITASALKAKKSGITSHAEVTKAFGGSHTDPGPLWPRRWFMSRVRAHYAALTGTL